MPGASLRLIQPCGIGRERLGEHEVAPLQAPFRRVERELEERRIGEARHQVGVGRHSHAVGPGVRREDEVMLLRHDRDAPQSGDAADERGIRLQHVDAAAA